MLELLFAFNQNELYHCTRNQRKGDSCHKCKVSGSRCLFLVLELLIDREWSCNDVILKVVDACCCSQDRSVHELWVHTSAILRGCIQKGSELIQLLLATRFEDLETSISIWELGSILACRVNGIIEVYVCHIFCPRDFKCICGIR